MTAGFRWPDEFIERSYCVLKLGQLSGCHGQIGLLGRVLRPAALLLADGAFARRAVGMGKQTLQADVTAIGAVAADDATAVAKERREDVTRRIRDLGKQARQKAFPRFDSL
jgi:hypothetical protein